MDDQDRDQDNVSNWLTVDQAALFYGVAAKTIRRRIARGELTARQVEIPQGFEWRVQPPDEAPQPQVAEQGSGQVSNPGTALIPLDQLELLLRPLVAERERLEAERDKLASQVDNLQQARLDDAAELGRLRGLLEAATQTTPPPEPQPEPQKQRRQWFWQRKRVG